MADGTVDIGLDFDRNDFILTSSNDLTLTENWQSQSLFLSLVRQKETIFKLIDEQDGLALEQLLLGNLILLDVDPQCVNLTRENHELIVTIRNERYVI